MVHEGVGVDKIDRLTLNRPGSTILLRLKQTQNSCLLERQLRRSRLGMTVLLSAIYVEIVSNM